MHALPSETPAHLRAPVHETLLLLRAGLAEQRFGRLAAVSSFGADSAVLLHLISQVERDTPILFIDTRMLFQETLDYKAELIRFLGLTDVRTVAPDGQVIREKDPWGSLHKTDPDGCCAFRKTNVLHNALNGFDGWISGRKRHQSFSRSGLSHIEHQVNGRTKLNPLADWSAQDLKDYAFAFDLPQHTLVNEGYPSIGCAPCTSKVSEGEDMRSGRWRGMDKVECGIHFENGKIVRTGAVSNND
ncbi:MAG: phosphoadenylyl-sulfate reductase [Pseudomonadota bacterium]